MVPLDSPYYHAKELLRVPKTLNTKPEGVGLAVCHLQDRWVVCGWDSSNGLLLHRSHKEALRSYLSLNPKLVNPNIALI